MLYPFRRLLVAGLSAATALFTYSESKTMEYTFTLVALRASPSLPNVTTRAELNNPALSPDCNLDRLMLLVNDVFPGPTIRADAGDIIKVTLINESPQSVSLHFHGLDMVGQPYSDGTSSVNQCAADNMTVVEADGTIIEPFVVENLDIMPGQRYSVLVTFDKDVGTYLATTGVRYRSQSPTGYILFKYQGAGEGVSSILEDEVDNLLQGTAGYSSSIPPHPVWNDTEPTIALQSKLFTKNPGGYYDYYKINQNDDSFIRRIVIAGNQLTQNSTGKLRWAANNVTSMMGPAPMITLAYDAVTTDGALPWPGTKIPGTLIVPDKPPTPYNYTAPVQDSVGTFNGETGPSYIPLVEGEVVEIVLQNTLALNGVAEMHTWHLHGHSFWVVGSGAGIFDEKIDPDSYNLVNPVRRDTATVLPYGWTALRFLAYNPGAWFFHCAQPAHAAMGMGVIFVISPEKCPAPPPTARSCLQTSMIPESESSSSNMIPKIKATTLIALAISLLV